MKLCRYPWLGMHFLTNGEVMVCPASQSSPTRGLTGERWQKTNDLEKIRNGEMLKKIRAEMLKGRLPEEFCSRCLAEEEAGLDSWRMKNESSFRVTDGELMNKTLANGTIMAGTLPLQQLSFRLSNKCNLKCRMCHPASSKALYEEWVALEGLRFRVGSEKVRLVRKDGVLQEENSPFSWFENFFENLQKESESFHKVDFLHFSGGEPLMDRNHLELLKLLISQGRAEKITLDYATNLTILPREVMDCWSRFKKIRVSVSWDGRRKAQEYIRFPLRYDSFLRNVKMLDRATGNFDLWVNSTISLLNVWDYPLFLQEFLEMGLKRYNVISRGETREFFPSFHILRKPESLSLNRVSHEGKRRLRAHYLKQLLVIEEILKKHGLHVENFKGLFDGILNSINPQQREASSPLSDLRHQDDFRKMKYLDYIPELEQLV